MAPTIWRWLIYGVIFGLCFPLGALSLDIIFSNLAFSWQGIKQAYSDNFLHWIIVSAPIILGFTGFLIGTSRYHIERQTKNLERLVDERTQELNNNKLELSEFINSAPVMMWMTGPTGNTLTFNAAWLNDTNRNLKEELSFNWTGENIHPDDRDMCLSLYKKSITQKKPFKHQFRSRRDIQEQYRWILESGIPRFSNTGEYMGHTGICLDVSDQVDAEKKLFEEKERFQTLFEKSGDGLVLVDEGKFIDCNEKAVIMMGYASKAELMKSPAALYPEYQPDGRLSAEKLQEMDAICLSEGSNLFECVHQKQDGTNFWVEVLLTRLDYEGRQIIHVSWRDISLQKQLLIENEKVKNDAIKSNLAKSEFLSSMSHELRTPLNAILGFSQLLEMGDDEHPLSEEQKSSVNYILSSGHHLLTLINDVLELSAIEAGKMVLSIEPIQLIDVIADSVSLISPIATKASIHVHVSSDLPLTVNADNTKLKQILINLISNAIKYNRKDGSVKIDWKPVKNGMVRVSIADTGIGISANNQKKVFNAFNRLGQENSSIEGTGIGLLVTKDLVEMMAGKIGFHSIEQQGTTFWFELPLTEASENEQVEIEILKTEDSISDLDGNKTILYVEDNPANRQLMQSFFKRQKNYHLTLVETGELGWEVALEQNFDLILMDIHLPGIDGKALTEKLRETSQYKNQPIVAMTAAAMTHDIQAAEGLFDDYLTKPVEIPKLLNILKKHLI